MGRSPGWGARVGACARLPSACSERLPLCPPPQASTAGNCALSVSSTRTQGAATAPTRGPKTPPEQILGDNRALTWGALQLPKPLPEAQNMGPNSAVLPMHPCIRTRIQYKSADAGTNGAPLPRFWLRAGSPLSCCSSSLRGERSR